MADWRSLLDASLRSPLFQPYGQPPGQVPDPYQALSSYQPPQGTPPALAQLLGHVATSAQPSDPQPAARHQSHGRTVLVGDSLGVGTSPYLQGVKANAVVGRSSASAVQALRPFVRGGNVGTIVFDAGTNDASAGQLAQSIHRASRLAPDARIVAMTVNGPGAAEKNALLRHLASQGRITLVDWAKASRGLVGADGIHAGPRGYRQRAALIEAALR
jgi:hypothetical protein